VFSFFMLSLCTSLRDSDDASRSFPGSRDVPTTDAPLSPVKTDVTMRYVKRNCEPRSSGHEEA
jgi:hypothetical protein